MDSAHAGRNKPITGILYLLHSQDTDTHNPENGGHEPVVEKEGAMPGNDREAVDPLAGLEDEFWNDAAEKAKNAPADPPVTVPEAPAASEFTSPTPTEPGKAAELLALNEQVSATRAKRVVSRRPTPAAQAEAGALSCPPSGDKEMPKESPVAAQKPAETSAPAPAQAPAPAPAQEPMPAPAVAEVAPAKPVADLPVPPVLREEASKDNPFTILGLNVQLNAKMTDVIAAQPVQVLEAAAKLVAQEGANNKALADSLLSQVMPVMVQQAQALQELAKERASVQHAAPSSAPSVSPPAVAPIASVPPPAPPAPTPAPQPAPAPAVQVAAPVAAAKPARDWRRTMNLWRMPLFIAGLLLLAVLLGMAGANYFFSEPSGKGKKPAPAKVSVRDADSDGGGSAEEGVASAKLDAGPKYSHVEDYSRGKYEPDCDEVLASPVPQSFIFGAPGDDPRSLHATEARMYCCMRQAESKGGKITGTTPALEYWKKQENGNRWAKSNAAYMKEIAQVQPTPVGQPILGSSKGALGTLQIQPAVAKAAFDRNDRVDVNRDGVANPLDPDERTAIWAVTIRNLASKYGDEPDGLTRTIACYQSGDPEGGTEAYKNEVIACLTN